MTAPAVPCWVFKFPMWREVPGAPAVIFVVVEFGVSKANCNQALQTDSGCFFSPIRSFGLTVQLYMATSRREAPSLRFFQRQVPQIATLFRDAVVVV